MIFTFDDFELDDGRFELRCQGRHVAVQPKVLRLLLVLVAQRHRAVSEPELMELLWPGEKVGSASIKRAVVGARAALGDRSQGCIRTVRKHGYQFVLPVQEREAVSTPRASELPIAMPKSSSPAALPAQGFVGRAGVFAELDASIERAMAGQGHCVLLLGEPGMGKTRLLHEASARASAVGARVWSGRCLEVDGAPPYWPMLQVLRAAMQGRTDEELHALLGPGASDIAEGFPELQPRLHELPASPAVGSARFRFFDSTARFLMRAADEQPVVLLFDDLHRADQATLRLLCFIARQISAARLLIVGSARPMAHRDGEAHERLDELARESATRSVELLGLTQGEIAHYLTLRTRASAPPEVVERLHDQTAGNPLFLEEILLSLRASEARTHQADAAPGTLWERLPQLGHSLGLRGAIECHLSTLSEPCRALLGAASVIGRDFSLGLLKPLLGKATELSLALLAEAMAAGILQSTQGAVGSYRFTHALIRDVLYERIDVIERARRHARVGLALEARGAGLGDDTELAQIAEHFRHAAPTHDDGKALCYAQRAAEAAMQRLAFEEAALQLERALALLDLGEPNAVLRVQLLLACGKARAMGSEPATARTCLLQAVAIARTLGATDVIAQAARVLGRSRESGITDSTLVEVLREALAALSVDDPRTPCLQAMLAKALSYSSAYTQRSELALSALSLASRLVDHELRAEALYACHEALTAPEHIQQRVVIADELSRLAHQHADSRIMLCALTAQFQNSIERGDVATLDVVIDALHALAQQVRDPAIRWYEKCCRGTRAMIAGDFARAEQYATEAFELGKLVGQEAAYHCYCAQVAGLYRMQDRKTEAEAVAAAMCSRFPTISGWRSFAAVMHAEAGRESAARETLAQLLADDLALLRRDPYFLSALCPAVALCVRVGDELASRTLYQALLPYERFHGNVSFGAATYGPIALHLAQLAVRMNALESARKHWADGLAEAERMQSPTFTAMACLGYAYTLTLRSRPEERARSIELLARATQLAEALGMLTTLARCHDLARLQRAL